VSNIAKEFTDAQGGRSYQIGTRNAQTTLRLHDGETQILGGLISDQDRNTASKIPGLGHLPVAGRLFGNNNGSTSKTEILLSITPHIIRAPAAADPALREMFTGTETSLREKPLRLDPVGELRVPLGNGQPAVVGATNAAGDANAQRTVVPGAAAAAAASNERGGPDTASDLSPAQQLRNLRRPAVVPFQGGNAPPAAPAASAQPGDLPPLPGASNPGPVPPSMRGVPAAPAAPPASAPNTSAAQGLGLSEGARA
jgi:general secretion pathway protein D